MNEEYLDENSYPPVGSKWKIKDLANSSTFEVESFDSANASVSLIVVTAGSHTIGTRYPSCSNVHWKNGMYTYEGDPPPPQYNTETMLVNCFQWPSFETANKFFYRKLRLASFKERL